MAIQQGDRRSIHQQFNRIALTSFVLAPLYGQQGALKDAHRAIIVRFNDSSVDIQSKMTSENYIGVNVIWFVVANLAHREPKK